jgi:hypothetical protein
MYDRKFRFSEVFINSGSNKTSGSGFIGVIMGLVGCLGFIASIVGYFLQLPETIDFMQQTIFFIGGATVLLGARKWVGGRQGNNINMSAEGEGKHEKG